ncbi:hypothetical protein EII29_08785 [Leptotrichia sp. OH3620_COT-345]|uniref:hypothetical protein n=1 Tax=Leptotrichia sp. OH3620_COT-345 TaxID=2491048 RepID=UPI000F64B4BB|nr:hypothetical protein [Leptotrichia sp. OH3620_COT-345]RRD39075.1 hypothetical protein EII29_08785 [Leptotrichia sp. OH3620_COT-345]
MLKKFLILFLLLSSLSFTVQYEIVKKSNVNLTISGMKSNAEKIANKVKNEIEKRKLIENIKKGYKSRLSKSDRNEIEEKFLNIMFTFYLRIFEKELENTNIQIEKINYISFNKAIVTLMIKFPDEAYFQEEIFEKKVAEAFEKKTGENLEKLDFDILVEEKAKKLLDELSIVINKVFEKEKINVKNYKIKKKTIKAVKINKNWEIEGILSIFD